MGFVYVVKTYYKTSSHLCMLQAACYVCTFNNYVVLYALCTMLILYLLQEFMCNNSHFDSTVISDHSQ